VQQQKRQVVDLKALFLQHTLPDVQHSVDTVHRIRGHWWPISWLIVGKRWPIEDKEESFIG
jgi:hypothetical protein